MMTLDRKYRDELTLALRLYDISGVRVGEVLAEVESHVAETGEDPVAAFGTPKEYAAKVAEQLDERTGKPSMLQNTVGALAVGALGYGGLTLLIDGLRADGDTIPVTAATVVSAAIYIVLMTVGIILLFRAATALVKAKVWGVIGGAILAAAIAGILLTKAFIDDQAPLIELAPWLAITLGVAALAGALALLARAIKHGRVVDPR